MPRLPLHCTVAVLCCNVVKSRGVRGWMPSSRQFANSAIEEADLRPRQTFDRETSSQKGSRGRVPSTSKWNRSEAKYCVGCRTRQKERKQKSLQQRESTWPPRYSHYCFTHSVAQIATGAASEPKTSKDLPTAPWSQASAGFRSLVSHRRHELANASDTEVRLTSTIDAAPTFGHGRAQLHLSLSSGLLFLYLDLVLLTG